MPVPNSMPHFRDTGPGLRAGRAGSAPCPPDVGDVSWRDSRKELVVLEDDVLEFSLLQTSLSVSHTEPRRSLLTHVVDDLGRRGANASSPLALVGAGSARSSTRDIIAWPGACVLSVSFAVTLIFVVVLWTVMLEAHQASKALAPRGAMAGGPGLANYRSGAGTGSQAEDQGLGRPTRIPGEVQRTLTPPSFGVREASRPMVPHICPSLSLLQGACQFRIPVQSLELLQAGYFPTQILSPTGNPLLHAWLPLCQKTPQTGPPAQAQLGHLLQLTTTAALSRHPHASIGLLTVGAKEQKAEIFGPKNLKYGSLVRSNDKWLVYHHHEGSEQLALTLHHMPAALGFCARAAEGHEVASATRIAGGSGEVLSITINPGGDALLALLCFLAVVLSMLETVVVPNEAPPVPPPAALPKEAQEALKDEEPPNEELKREALEIARRSALTDEGLKDAPLSTKGHEQAEITAANVSKIIREEELKAPEAVFVSPLQRALQTAARMFPEHQEVHVCDLLRERCTGFPCDERSEVPSLRSRKSFRHMSFDQVIPDDDEIVNLEDEEVMDEPPVFRRFHTWPLIEEKFMLRQRTAGLGRLLQTTEAESVCIVTHKGFLRELERGPLGRTEASEFGNCEVRVYEVCVSDGEILQADLMRAL
ncbi:Hypothetical protein SCF082_LOCUS32012 [Durusdinium trenchii]|uniref:Uncharacterized protein n=1 Tax=Durusdinium trenchii TaxID=1381693 RepID=A0ABP0NEW5_9DINO